MTLIRLVAATLVRILNAHAVQRKIFSNVEMIVEGNRLLLEKLDVVMEEESADTTIGDVFSDFVRTACARVQVPGSG